MGNTQTQLDNDINLADRFSKQLDSFYCRYFSAQKSEITRSKYDDQNDYDMHQGIDVFCAGNKIQEKIRRNKYWSSDNGESLSDACFEIENGNGTPGELVYGTAQYLALGFTDETELHINHFYLLDYSKIRELINTAGGINALYQHIIPCDIHDNQKHGKSTFAAIPIWWLKDKQTVLKEIHNQY
jgi:hypothetical protein